MWLGSDEWHIIVLPVTEVLYNPHCHKWLLHFLLLQYDLYSVAGPATDNALALKIS